MEPCMAANDKKMFYNYLNKASVYLEYGSGGSTYQAAIRDTIKRMYSVESDFEWHTTLKNKLENNSKVQFIYNEMAVLPNT